MNSAAISAAFSLIAVFGVSFLSDSKTYSSVPPSRAAPGSGMTQPKRLELPAEISGSKTGASVKDCKMQQWVSQSYSKRNMTMTTTEIIRRYVDAWNGHDAAVLVANFTKNGTYCNPHTYPGISVEKLAEFANGVWTTFPDFSIELLNAGQIEPGVGALYWLARGTNTGPGVDGSDPTGRTVSFKGASIVQIEGDKLRSDDAYFDPKRIEEQLAAK